MTVVSGHLGQLESEQNLPSKKRKRFSLSLKVRVGKDFTLIINTLDGSFSTFLNYSVIPFYEPCTGPCIIRTTVVVDEYNIRVTGGEGPKSLDP